MLILHFLCLAFRCCRIFASLLSLVGNVFSSREVSTWPRRDIGHLFWLRLLRLGLAPKLSLSFATCTSRTSQADVRKPCTSCRFVLRDGQLCYDKLNYQSINQNKRICRTAVAERASWEDYTAYITSRCRRPTNDNCGFMAAVDR